MLLDSFYTIHRKEGVPGSVKATLDIRTDHPILKGHFPGQPVVPGVCMMQMVKELLEQALQKKLLLAEADNMKFLSLIDPRINSRIEAAIAYSETPEGISMNASLFSGTVTFFKLKASLHVTEE